MMREHQGKTEGDLREWANDFFNALPWISDDEHWGKRDYWATPIEMLATNGGDCEDFSIGKYLTLTQLLALVTSCASLMCVRAPRLRQAHMVLAYYEHPGADPCIFDNLDPVIRRGSQRTNLIPVYSFNAEGLWKAKARGLGRRARGAKRLLLWGNLLGRLERQLRR